MLLNLVLRHYVILACLPLSILGYSDVSFPVQKRSSFSSSSFLITWISGDWDLQLQQVRWEQVFSSEKTGERSQKLELQLILCAYGKKIFLCPLELMAFPSTRWSKGVLQSVRILSRMLDQLLK